MAEDALEGLVVAGVDVAVAAARPLAPVLARVDREVAPVVVEARRPPGARRVAALALDREAGCLVVRVRGAAVVALMAGVAVRRACPRSGLRRGTACSRPSCALPSGGSASCRGRSSPASRPSCCGSSGTGWGNPRPGGWGSSPWSSPPGGRSSSPSGCPCSGPRRGTARSRPWCGRRSGGSGSGRGRTWRGARRRSCGSSRRSSGSGRPRGWGWSWRRRCPGGRRRTPSRCPCRRRPRGSGRRRARRDRPRGGRTRGARSSRCARSAR